MFIFVVPHQFIRGFCEKLNGNIKPNAIGISLIKVHIQICELFCVNVLLSWRFYTTVFLGIKRSSFYIVHCLLFSSDVSAMGCRKEFQYWVYIRNIVFFLQGMDHTKDGLQLISDVIRNSLKIDMSVLMGANIASEVADEKFCETTIGIDVCFSCRVTLLMVYSLTFYKVKV